MTIYGFLEEGRKTELQDNSRFALEYLKDALSTDNKADKDAGIRRACMCLQDIQATVETIKNITQ